MNPNAEFDLIVYGASGYTGRLVAEHLAQRYGVGGEVKWAMAGRSAAKLAQVRDEIGAPATRHWWSPTPPTRPRCARWCAGPRR